MSLLQWFEPGPLGEIWRFSRVHARPAHHHPEVEFNVVTNGTAVYRVGARRFVLRARSQGSERFGFIVPIRSMVEHELVAASDDLDMWVVYAPPAESEGRALGLTLPLVDLVLDGWRRVEKDALDALNDCCKIAHSERSKRAMTRLYTQTALAYHLASARETVRTHTAVLRALARLEQDPSLSRSDLAVEVGTSDAELSRLTKRSLAVPLVVHRNRLRLARLLEMASSRHCHTAQRSLLDLAYEAGFGSSASLHRVFAREAGFSPSDYLRGGVRVLTDRTKNLAYTE